MGVAARRRRQQLADVAIDSSVMLLPTDDRGFKLAVALAVTLPSVSDPHEAMELVRAAHRVCPYSNATRGNVDVFLTANGRSVDDAAEPQAA
jgi:organic hydroperoxide reductase OsmC/OhrA